MDVETKIQDLQERIQRKMDSRAKLMEVFVDAPGSMESKSDHTRQDIATEISIIDKAIQDLREIIFQLKTFAPRNSDVVQVGHTVSIQIEDADTESFLLLDGLGGILLGDLSTLSINTPIGQSILGKKVGERVVVSVPSGQLDIKILSIE
jgi:transcription elongation factor GreA